MKLKDRWGFGLLGAVGLCAVFWRAELGVLRGEVLRVGRARLEILSKRMPDGRTVLESMVPSTVVVIRDREAYYVCGKSRVRKPSGPEYK